MTRMSTFLKIEHLWRGSWAGKGRDGWRPCQTVSSPSIQKTSLVAVDLDSSRLGYQDKTQWQVCCCHRFVRIDHDFGFRWDSNRFTIEILSQMLNLVFAVLVVSTSTYVVAEVIQTRVPNSITNQNRSSIVLMDAGAKNVGIFDHADVMDGIAMVSLTVFWCLLGLYSKNLAYRLYNSSKFLDMVRLHAKVSLKLISYLSPEVIVIFRNVMARKTISNHNRATPTYFTVSGRRTHRNSTEFDAWIAWWRPSRFPSLFKFCQLCDVCVWSISDNTKSQRSFCFLLVDDHFRSRAQRPSLLYLVCGPGNLFIRYLAIARSNWNYFCYYFLFVIHSWRFAFALPNPFHRLVRFLRLCHSLEFACWHRPTVSVPDEYNG